ncbi:hypothetical protein OAQ99_07945, partial [Candidatus Kapabacteria bacterium]|nr:hypothetical protein [Candidatus Kapabacteria bacterium]
LDVTVLTGSYDLNLTGDLTIGGTLDGGALNDEIIIIFQGSSILTVTGTFTPFRIDVTVGNTLTLASSIASGNGLPGIIDINIDGTLDCGTNTVNLPLALGTFDLAAGATLSTDVATGVDGTIIGSGTETYNNATNYIFESNVTDTGFGTITDVHDMGFDGCTISTTTDLTISGRIYEIANADINTTGDTWTLTGNETGDNNFNVNISNLVVNGTYNGFGRARIRNSLTIGAAGNFTANNSLEFILDAGASISNSGSLSVGTIRPLGTLTSNGTLSINGLTDIAATDWTHSTGTVTCNSNDQFSNGVYDFANLTLVGNWLASIDISVQGTLNVTGSIVASAGTVSLTGPDNISGAGTITFNNLTINGNYIQTASLVTVNGDIDLDANTYDIGTNSITLNGDIISDNTNGNIDATEPNSTLTLGGTTALNIGASEFSTSTVGNLILTKSNVVTINANFGVAGNLTMNNASLDINMNGFNFLLFGDFNFTAGEILSSGQFQYYGTGNLTMPDCFTNSTVEGFGCYRNGTITIPYDLTVSLFFEINNASGVVDMEDNSLTIGNNIVFTAGELDLTDDNSTLVLTGTGTTFANSGFTNGEIGNLTIQRNSITTLNADLTIDGSLTLDNAGAELDIDTHTLTVGGGITYNSGFLDATDNSSTLIFTGTTAVNLDAAALENDEVGNLILNLTNTISLNDNLTVDGDCTIGSGFNSKLDINGNTMTFNGNMIRPFGAFGWVDGFCAGCTIVIAGTGNVTMDDFFFASQVQDFSVQKDGIFEMTDNMLI